VHIHSAVPLCVANGKPDALDQPPPEPVGSGLFRQRYPGDSLFMIVFFRYLQVLRANQV
jgi:hypothetical protein